MKVNPHIYFDNRYFFDKQELRKHIEDILNSDEDKSKKRKENLFDLYRSGGFERFCGLKPTESELIPALQAIKNCLGLNTELSMHLGDYCSIENTKIEGSTEFHIGIAPSTTSIKSFTVSPFYLSLEAIKHNNDIKFVFFYNVQNTISQRFVPSLVFASEGSTVHEYASNDDIQIDLAERGQGSIGFTIPALDVFTQGEGSYVLKFGTSDMASVIFPRCGLPIGEGIYSLEEFLEFRSRLDDMPLGDLFSLYELIRGGFLDAWLQNSEEKGISKERVTECLYRKFENPGKFLEYFETLPDNGRKSFLNDYKEELIQWLRAIREEKKSQLIEVVLNAGGDSAVDDLLEILGEKISGHEYVDLGLPSGLLWATCNIGASSPSDYGGYYAWGETSTKNSYDWSNLKYCNDNENVRPDTYSLA